MDIASAAVSMGFRMISWCVALVLKFISLFIGYIDVLDAGLTVLVVWGMMCSVGWNGWLALVLGLITAVIVYIVFKHRIGFWVVTPVFSFIWSFVIVRLIFKEWWFKDITQKTFWVWAFIIFAWSFWSHYCAIHRAADNEYEHQAQERQRVHITQQPQAVQELWYDPRCGDFRPINTKPLEAYEPDWEYKQMKIRMEREERTK